MLLFISWINSWENLTNAEPPFEYSHFQSLEFKLKSFQSLELNLESDIIYAPTMSH